MRRLSAFEAMTFASAMLVIQGSSARSGATPITLTKNAKSENERVIEKRSRSAAASIGTEGCPVQGDDARR